MFYAFLSCISPQVVDFPPIEVSRQIRPQHSYVLNNPTNNTDPTGFATICGAGQPADTCKLVVPGSNTSTGNGTFSTYGTISGSGNSTVVTIIGTYGKTPNRPGNAKLGGGNSANNNHTAWASQKGFYVHQRATYLAIGKDLSKGDVETLAKAHVAADAPEYQDSASTHRHAMSRDGQSVEEARAEANTFVRKQFDRAWNAPTRTDALFEFGIALHAIQDSTSPSHGGFQRWTGHETFGEQVEHVRREMVNPGENSHLFDATREAWKWFNQRQLPRGDLFRFGCDGCQAKPTNVVM